MAALATVQAYIDRARMLLQDRVPPFRYPDDDLVQALNLSILEMRRLRPDLMRAYFREELPDYSATATNVAVNLDPMYRVAVVYYICAHMQLQDEEDVTDARAGAFLNKFNAQMLALQA